MDVNFYYNLWQRQEQNSLKLRQLINALYKVDNPAAFQYELDRIGEIWDDNEPLSEKRRAELTELLDNYMEPLMDRCQHETHLQSHRKYLERLAKYKRQDAIIAGLSPKGITAEKMANYCFAHIEAGKGVLYGGNSGLPTITGLDPETGEYTIILPYEGPLDFSLFTQYIEYTSTGKIDLYETIKSFFTAGHELGLVKSQLGQLLINLLDTKDVKESLDSVIANIFKNEMRLNPHTTILKIINLFCSREWLEFYHTR